MQIIKKNNKKIQKKKTNIRVPKTTNHTKQFMITENDKYIYSIYL